MSQPKQDFISILREIIAYSLPDEKKHYEESILNNSNAIASMPHSEMIDVIVTQAQTTADKNHVYLKLLTLQKYLDSKAVLLHDVLKLFNVRDASLIMEPFEIWHYVKINDDEFQLFREGDQPINYTTDVSN